MRPGVRVGVSAFVVGFDVAGSNPGGDKGRLAFFFFAFYSDFPGRRRPRRVGSRVARLGRARRRKGATVGESPGEAEARARDTVRRLWRKRPGVFRRATRRRGTVSLFSLYGHGTRYSGGTSGPNAGTTVADRAVTRCHVALGGCVLVIGRACGAVEVHAVRAERASRRGESSATHAIRQLDNGLDLASAVKGGGTVG